MATGEDQIVDDCREFLGESDECGNSIGQFGAPFFNALETGVVNGIMKENGKGNSKRVLETVFDLIIFTETVLNMVFEVMIATIGV